MREVPDSYRVGIQTVDRSSRSKSRAPKKPPPYLWLMPDNCWASLWPSPGRPWASARLAPLLFQTLSHLCLLSALTVLPSASCRSQEVQEPSLQGLKGAPAEVRTSGPASRHLATLRQEPPAVSGLSVSRRRAWFSASLLPTPPLPACLPGRPVRSTPCSSLAQPGPQQ